MELSATSDDRNSMRELTIMDIGRTVFTWLETRCASHVPRSPLGPWQLSAAAVYTILALLINVRVSRALAEDHT